jgi:hypothetical protein
MSLFLIHFLNLFFILGHQVRLGRTEQILRSRDRNLGEFLEELEAKRGVVG